MTNRRLSSFIDTLIAGGRPPHFRANPDDRAVLRMAIALRVARPGEAIPTEEFVSTLYGELANSNSSEHALIADVHKLRPGRALLAAVAATIVLVAGTVVATQAVHRAPATPSAVQAPRGQDVRTGTFETADNQVMGQIVAYRGHSSWVFMKIDGSNYSGPIVCKLQVEDGSTVAVGVFQLRHGKGEFSRAISLDTSRLRGAKLVTSTGSIVALATFA